MITGYKVWQLSSASDPNTDGVVYKLPMGWDERAVCRDRGMRHAAPMDGCTCGFYSFLEPGDKFWKLLAQRESECFGTVAALVKVYGVTIPYTKGYRSEFIQPLKFWTRYPEADIFQKLAARHAVPLLGIGQFLISEEAA